QSRIFLVIEDDQHYSPASIAGLVPQMIPSLTATNKAMLLAFSERKFYLTCSRRCSPGYNVCRLWRL
ncbi:MAG TPA: hypothetical protein VK892_10025, partial [Pyrinomonadaceae bacterium]|nr:hypothetical protein [Pyrinomonadaceae bacterium]